MNSQDYLDKINTFYQLALNEPVNVVRKALFEIIKDLIVMFQDEFLAEVEADD